ncbi:MAG: hypothetical protein H8E72_04180 [Candidatus Marinimicrobia bacterium]|nr:hypothetical protein [Candidatus Neomarinimicrobiota bacterium]
MKRYLILLSILTFSWAQQWGSPSSGGLDPEKVKMIKKWKLIDFLDISEDQSDMFFTRVNSFEKEMKSIRKKEKELRESIHELIEEDKLNKKKVSSLMDQYFELEKEKLDLRQNHHKEIGDILTPEQTVKYLVFDHHFKKRMKDKLNERKGGGRRKRF